MRESPKAAFVVDDILPPWQPRSVMVQGRARALEATGSGGSAGAIIRIIPDKVVCWGLKAPDK